MKTVLVLGALGGVGRAVAEAFDAAGWRVLGLVRPGRQGELPASVRPVTADLLDAGAVKAAAGPVDAVFDGLNVRYDRWQTEALPLYRAALAIAAALDAVHLFPGNVYVFGADMPEELTPDVPFAPTTRKGRIRVEIEALLADTAQEGRVRSVILRAGDFFGPSAGGSWIGAFVASHARKGTIKAPGPKTVAHAYAYLPDLGRAFVGLAEARDRLGAFEVFHFPGHTATMADLAAAASEAFGRTVAVKRIPEFVFDVLGWFSPVIGESREMAYLWSEPHRLVDPRLERVAGPLARTPLAQALEASITG